MQKNCHPGQAMLQHRAEPEPIVTVSQWVPALAALGRDDNFGLNKNG
jgi:hypothetical protein